MSSIVLHRLQDFWCFLLQLVYKKQRISFADIDNGAQTLLPIFHTILSFCTFSSA